MEVAYQVHHLANGLKIIHHYDADAPKVAVDLLYRVGARDEDPELTGFAHLFEHLMFGGSKNIPSYDTPLQKAGGENNAFTNNDITNYYLTLPPEQLETAFWLESDRMLELDFSQKSLDVQKSVVIEEFKQRYLNQPYGDAYLMMRPLQFREHPYGWMTIGKTPDHVTLANLDNVKAFFFNYYAPNNCTLVVAGPVDEAEVLRLAEKWFGPIPRREVKRRAYTPEPVQTEARSLEVRRKVPLSSVYKSYRMGSRTDGNYYAADLLTDVLTTGKSSRLYLKLVKEKQVATSVSTFTWGLYDPGTLSIDAVLAEGKTVAEYEAALDECINDLQNISTEELTRMQNRVESAVVFEKVAVLNRAMNLAIYDSFGQPELINTLIDNYRAVKAEDVRAAAADILRPESCSTLYYLPE
jgi:zinc protease